MSKGVVYQVGIFFLQISYNMSDTHIPVVYWGNTTNVFFKILNNQIQWARFTVYNMTYNHE